METSTQRVAELEWANYAAMLSSSQVTTGLEIILREDVILTSSTTLPTHDSNHACLLRTTTQGADDLIVEVKRFFQNKDLPVAIYISPACTPSDLPKRLLEEGFNRQAEEETWMVLERLSDFDIPSPYPGIRVKSIARDEAIVFAQVFMAAFELPSDFAPTLAQLLKPSVGLPNARHYIAFDGERPIGTCSLLCHESFGVLGSTGVLPQRRKAGAATTLAVRALTDAREMGVETLMLQTIADTWLEHFLHASGFTRAFTRRCYTLGDGPLG